MGKTFGNQQPPSSNASTFGFPKPVGRDSISVKVLEGKGEARAALAGLGRGTGNFLQEVSRSPPQFFLLPAFGAFPQDFFTVALEHPPRPRMGHVRGAGDVHVGVFRSFPRAADAGHEIGDVEPCALAVVDMDVQPVADVGEPPAGRSLARLMSRSMGALSLRATRLTAASPPQLCPMRATEWPLEA